MKAAGEPFDSHREVLDARNILKRTLLVALLTFFSSGLPWIFVLFLTPIYATSAYQPVATPLWLLNTVFPVLPGLAFFAAVIGIATRDRPVSFLVGFLPNIITWLSYASLSVMGAASIYLSTAEMAGGLLTLAIAAVGLGIVGLAGCYYRIFHDEGTSFSARMVVLLFPLGIFLWAGAIWVWPGWGVVIPGSSINEMFNQV